MTHHIELRIALSDDKEVKDSEKKRTEAKKDLRDPERASSEVQFLDKDTADDFERDITESKRLMNAGQDRCSVIQKLIEAYPEREGEIRLRLGA